MSAISGPRGSEGSHKASSLGEATRATLTSLPRDPHLNSSDKGAGEANKKTIWNFFRSIFPSSWFSSEEGTSTKETGVAGMKGDEEVEGKRGSGGGDGFLRALLLVGLIFVVASVLGALAK
jgi:hypothetical protein